MKKLVVMAVLAVCGIAGADILIWQEDYSDVSDWIVAWEEYGDTAASITTDGSVADLYINRNNSGAAFSTSGFMAFNEAIWDTYSLNFDVDSISGSMSYNVGFDEFDASYNYTNSVTVHSHPTYVGYTNYDLSAVAWHEGVAFVRPKISMNTGDGVQTMEINDMQLTSSIPEPTSAALIGLGIVATWAVRRKYARS